MSPQSTDDGEAPSNIEHGSDQAVSSAHQRTLEDHSTTTIATLIQKLNCQLTEQQMDGKHA